MTILAVCVLVSWALTMLPGSAFKPPKPELDYGSTKLYLSLGREIASIALAVAIVWGAA